MTSISSKQSDTKSETQARPEHKFYPTDFYKHVTYTVDKIQNM